MLNIQISMGPRCLQFRKVVVCHWHSVAAVIYGSIRDGKNVVHLFSGLQWNFLSSFPLGVV